MKYIPRGIPCLIVTVCLFGYLSLVMGFTNMLNTIMRTAHDLLLNTVFYLMAMCVLTGALSRIFSVFGVVDLLQKMLKPVLRPLFNLPGVSSAGALMTFLSDKPVIISVAKNPLFARYFKRYQHISLVNFAGSYAMGLLVIIFMMGHGFYTEPLYGLVGAIIGSIIATRLMQRLVLKEFPHYKDEDVMEENGQRSMVNGELKRTPYETVPDDPRQTLFVRVLDALLDGGKSGVEVGLAIIPGVLIISTLVMMFTFGTDPETGTYTGEAYQGTELLPLLAGRLGFVFKWLFGFNASELVAFPITALGTVGAALGLIPEMMSKGIIDSNAIAVFTAMGMCWSGFLSADAATLDSLGYRHFISRSFTCTFIGGIVAGIITHWLFFLITYLIELLNP
jgi:spore maturation protein SpmB